MLLILVPVKVYVAGFVDGFLLLREGFLNLTVSLISHRAQFNFNFSVFGAQIIILSTQTSILVNQRLILIIRST